MPNELAESPTTPMPYLLQAVELIGAQRSEGIENVPALCLMYMRELLRQMLLMQHHLMRQRIRIHYLSLPFSLLVAGTV